MLLKNKLILLVIIPLLFFSMGSVMTQNLESADSRDIRKLVWDMTNACWELREMNPDSAIVIGKQAKILAEKHELTDILPQINGFLGVIYFHYKYDLKSSIPYLQESLEKSMLVNDSTRLAYSYNNLGDVYLMSGNISLAKDYSEKSLGIFTSLDNKYGIAYGYINLGLIYQEEKNYSESTKYFQKALDLRNQIGDSTGYASALYQLAKSQQMSGDLELAMENYLKSYNYHRAINNLSYTAYCMNGMATINYLKGDYEESLKKYLEAIYLHELKGHPFGLVEDYLGIAMVYAGLGMKKEGQAALEKALTISHELEMHPKILETYRVYANFYQTFDNKKAALDALNNYVVLYDSILLLQQIEVMEEVQRTEEKKKSLEMAEQELQTQVMQRNYMIIIIVLMVFIVAVFIWRIISQSKLNRQLRNANQTKDKLFSVISHDLRSPFNTILGFSELLKKSVPADQKEISLYANAVYEQSEETLRLIDNLLTWSRAQSNRIIFNPKDESLDQLFKQLETAFEYISSNNNVKLVFDNSVSGKIPFDKNIIKIVLTNLISNSFKYTNKGEKIIISSSVSGQHLNIKVSDTGIGIDNETLEMIVSHQFVSSRKGVRNESGTGLGLSICYELVKLHNGGMNIESTEGIGTEVTITIPVS